jgi:hypothetical protein
MDDLKFIRQQVRKILTEKNDERGISGGRGFEDVKEQVTFAEKSPGVVMERFGVNNYTPPGGSETVKVTALLQRIKGLSLNSEDFMLAVDRVEAEGDKVRVYPVMNEVEGVEKPVVATSRLGHYVKAILVAANGTGKVKYDPKVSPIKHRSGEYVVVTLK